VPPGCVRPAIDAYGAQESERGRESEEEQARGRESEREGGRDEERKRGREGYRARERPLKSLSAEELRTQKRDLHVATFRYLLEETRRELDRIAREEGRAST
jgi:hypothetical protein